LDFPTRRLFCACDSGIVYILNADTGKILAESVLTGKPDVIFYNSKTNHLYVAVGDPGIIDVLNAIRQDFTYDRMIIAAEMKEFSPDFVRQLIKHLAEFLLKW
jgi:DNA-binding beta-propeller fold protein YncE